MDAYEAFISKCGGKYSFGDNVTMADAFLIPQVYNVNRFEMDINTWPTIAKVVENLN